MFSETAVSPDFPLPVGPCDHLLHVYRDETVLLDTLEGFVNGGFRGGEIVIVIATAAHLYALESRLKGNGRDIGQLQDSGQYVALDAAQVLDSFMVDGMPDQQRFDEAITARIEQAQQGGQHVRAFGEMVALLWTQGQREATLRLEQMWNGLCQQKQLSLFCAYPHGAGYSEDELATIHALHTHSLPDDEQVAA